ncbi:hypothetical protein P7C73_g6357, partial [Tremellales sp. Uapishka_1]
MAQVLSPSESFPTRRQHLVKTFEGYRSEFDSFNERRERLIILSRSITQLSKKLIFHLHRGATSASPIAREKLLKEAWVKEKEIVKSFGAVWTDLKGLGGEKESFWRFNRQVSPGLEEYIEGLSFLWYLEKRTLITLDEIQHILTDEKSGEPLVVVTPEDYILGMSDLTGELMRYATNALSSGDHETPLTVCDFVRTVKSYFDSIPPHMLRKLQSKQEETTRSLEKIEKVCYSLRLRLIEFADRPEVLAMMAKRALDDDSGVKGDDRGTDD